MTAFLIVGIIVLFAAIFTPITLYKKKDEERKRSITNVSLEKDIRITGEEAVLKRLDELNPPLYELYDTVLALYKEFSAPVYNDKTFGVGVSGNLTFQRDNLSPTQLYARGYAWQVIGAHSIGWDGHADKRPIGLKESFVKDFDKQYSTVEDSLGNKFYPNQIAQMISHCYLYRAETAESEVRTHCLDINRSGAKKYFKAYCPITFEYCNEHLEEYISLYEQNPIEFRDDVTPSYIYKRIDPVGLYYPIDADGFFNIYIHDRIENLIDVLTSRGLYAKGYHRSPDGKRESAWQEREKEEKFRDELKKQYPKDFN